MNKWQRGCKNPKEYVCKKIIPGILLYELVKMINIQEVLLVIQYLLLMKF